MSYIPAQPINVFNRIHYSTKDGLPSNTVYCAVQDDDGFIWFGTDAGLSRFDGVDFINYGLKDGLPDMEILNFHKDHKGRIWIYTFNGKLCFIEDGEIYSAKNTSFLEELDFNSRITSINTEGDYVFITSLGEGVKIINDQKGLVKSINDGKNYCYGALINDTYFYFFTNRFFSYRFFHEKVDSIAASKPFDSFNISLLGKISSTALSYCGAVGDNIIGISHSLNENFIFLLNTQSKEIRIKRITGYNVYNYRVNDDTIFLFTSEGVKIIDTETLEITDWIGLEKTTLFSSDVMGNVWLTTLNNGIFFLPKNEVKRKQVSIYEDVIGMDSFGSHLYIVNSNNAVLKVDSLDNYSHLFTLKDISAFIAIEVDSLETIWTLNSTSFRKNNVEVVFPDSYFETGSAFYFKDNTLLGLKRSELWWWNLDEGTYFSTKNDKLGKTYGYEYLDNRNVILANQHGLFLLNLKKKSVSIIPAFQDVRVTSISLDKYENFWLATAGYGLIRIPMGEITSFSLEKIKQFRVDNYSDIYEKIFIIDSVSYASNPRGITRVLFDESGIKYQYHISESNGLEPGRINGLEYFNKNIFIAHSNGIFYFPHDQSFSNDPEFPLYIEKITTTDSIFSYKDSDRIILPHNPGPIRFETKAVYFRNQNDLTYQYRLKDSFQKINWNTTNNNEFVFQSLPSGDYEFEVRAKATNSPWTLPVSQKFSIQSIYWQTWWFKVIITFIVVTSIGLIYYFSSTARRKRTALKKNKIESDLKALKAQINPHFLFNSLNSIQSFVLEGSKDIAEDYLVKYSKLMRTILNHSNLLSVPIYEEIELMKLYVELEKLRLYQKVEFNVSVDSQINTFNTKVPSMIIQPLIENSIWHGLQNISKPGQIHLNFELKGGLISVSVKDNGKGFSINNEETNPRGIQLVKERIDLINKLEGIKSNFEISTNNSGTKVTFSYPSNLN